MAGEMKADLSNLHQKAKHAVSGGDSGPSKGGNIFYFLLGFVVLSLLYRFLFGMLAMLVTGVANVSELTMRGNIILVVVFWLVALVLTYLLYKTRPALGIGFLLGLLFLLLLVFMAVIAFFGLFL